MIMKWEITFNPAHYVGTDKTNNVQIVTSRFFSDKNGYSVEDTGAAVMLEVGESVYMDGGSQVVKRIR